MSVHAATPCVIFLGQRRIAAGPLAEAIRTARTQLESGVIADLLVFDAQTGRLVDLDWRGQAEAVVARLPPAPQAEAPPPPPAGRGRPRLGVVAREVTLLPRHWEWLAQQPGGASVVLRQLVERARLGEGDAGRRRASQEAAHRFMTAMAGNLPGYEEALRSLFAGDALRFAAQIAGWPEDVATQATALASAALAPPAA